MKDIHQLADTGTADVAGIIPEVWSKQVEEAARPKRVCRNLIKVNTDLLNKPGDLIRIPRRGTVTAGALAEHGTVTPSLLTYTTALTLTPSEVGAAVAITRQSVDRGYVNLVGDSTVELGEALAQKEDQDIITALSGATSNALFGGNATGTADIAAGDVLSPSLFAEAIKDIRKNDFEPDAIIIAPEQQWTLSTWPQFTNAATFGGRQVIETGYVPSYMGVKVYTSTNVTSGTGGTGTDIAYHTCYMMDSKRAAAIAVKRNPTVETEYKTLERKHYVTATMEYAAGLLNNAAVCEIMVSDS